MDKKEKINQITEGVIWKQLLLFFFPIVFGTFFQQIYNTADTIVVGRFVGKEALAAVGGSASQIANLIVGFFVGLSSGAAVVISQFYGAKDKKNVSKALHTAFAFSIAAGVALTIAGIFFTRPALLMMKTPADVVEDSVIYLHIYFGGMIFNLIYNMGAAILRAVGDSKRPLYVLIITCVLNIVLDILFVVLFRWGVTGVAVATVASQVVSALIVTGMLLKTQEIYRLKFNQIRFDRRMLLSVLRIGIPAGLESVMYNISNIVIQVFVNNLGTDTVAAWGTLGKIDALFWMVINAFAISITTFVGQNFGAGKYHRMRKSVRVCMTMSMVSSAVMISMMYVWTPWIYRLFTTDSGGCRCTYEPLYAAVLFYLCDHRHSFRGIARNRKSSGTNDPYLWRCLFSAHYMAVQCRQDVSGNQYDHAELSGVLEYYSSAVCCILFYEISGRKQKRRKMSSSKELMECNFS